MNQHVNPFEGMSSLQKYQTLRRGTLGPKWPSEELQRGYTGAQGVALLDRAFAFIDILDRDGAFKPDWRGLDYGCGWGRFPSTLLTKGAPHQLDACDAWPGTLKVINSLGYQNKIFGVPELLSEGDIPKDAYDFILSFSVFTHLSPKAFDANIPVLLAALREGGNLYVTVRHDEFIDHKYADRASELRSVLDRDGVLFLDSGGDMTGEKIFGDTVVTQGYMSRFGKAHYLGKPHDLQHVYAISR